MDQSYVDSSIVNAEQIAFALDKPRRTGTDRYIACCVAHKDRSPSLAISDVDGKTLVYCFAGCSQDEVITALRSMGLWTKEKRRAANEVYFTKKDLLEMDFYIAIADSDRGKRPLTDAEVKRYNAYKKVLLSKGVKL